MKRKFIKVYSLISIIMLCACGGGGGGGGNSGEPAVDGGANSSGGILVGKLVAPQIAGLRYATESQSGYTNSNSEFTYKSGELIQFYLGDTEIGDAVSVKNELTFAGLFPEVGNYLNFHALKELYSLRSDSEERKSFNRLHNALALLIAFDGDSDFLTEIELTGKVNEIIDGVVFRLESDVHRFSKSDPAFFYYRNIAYAEDAVVTAANRSPGMVMDSYFSSIGRTVNFSLPTYIAADYNSDGVPERVERYSYDDEGNRISQFYSNSGAGPLIGSTTTYDEYGRVLTNSYDADGDAISDSYSEVEYSVEGNLASVRIDHDADGIFEGVRTHGYEFQDGNYIYRYSEDYEGDGVSDLAYRMDYVFSDRGLLDSTLYDGVKMLALEYRSDGTVSAEHYYRWTGDLERTKTFDNSGRILVDEIFGSSPKRWEYVYSEQGRLVQVGYEESGRKLYVDNNEFDESGRLLYWERDANGDGTANMRREYVYSDGLLVKEDWYEVSVGGVEITDWPSSTVSYGYDERGLVVERLEVDHTYDAPDDPDGGKERTVYQYNLDGNLIWLGRDSGADGNFEYETRYELAAVGWRAALEWISSNHAYAKLPYEEKPYQD